VTSRHDYLPFGEEILQGEDGRGSSYPASTGPTTDGVNQKFTGKERDAETASSAMQANDYFGARYYSSSQGRFTSPDWSALPQPVPYAELTDPQTLNLYGYVRNNPLTISDADGHGLVCKGPDGNIISCPPPGKDSKAQFTVTVNSRPANIPLGSAMDAIGKDHQWITTSEGKSAGMGPAKNGGQVPGGNGQSTPDKPLDPTQVVDHHGEAPTSTTTYTNVDRGAINSYLQVGQSTGPWVLLANDCNTWVANAISQSIPHDIRVSVGVSGDPTMATAQVTVEQNVVVYADGSIHKPGEQ